MQATAQVKRYTLYSSDTCPAITTTDDALAQFIEWGDANPAAWAIVQGTRSKAFGRNSCFYLGCLQKSVSPQAALDRLVAYHRQLFPAYPDRPGETFQVWKAQFTLEHYRDKGFKGGLFQQFDGQYDRGCSTLDYTSATLDAVLERFVAWCGNTFETKALKIDGKVVRTY